MDLGPSITLITAVAIGACAIVLTLRVRVARRTRQLRTHEPHRPGAGYDRAEAIRKGVTGEGRPGL